MYSGKGLSRMGGDRSVWFFLVLALGGVVLGGFVGELLCMLGGAVKWLGFLRYLNYGVNFGLTSPVTADLGIVTLTLGFTVKFTVCGLLGLAAAVVAYRRM